jgi:hypothetical protein
MKQTLESFIDPKNIPKKYGGELDFEFGDMPQLDPHLENVLKWEGNNSDFPHGPMFWAEKTNSEREIEAIAVGSSNGSERKEVVCTVKILKDEGDLNSSDGSPKDTHKLRPDLLRTPTATLSDAEEPKDSEKVAPLPMSKQEQIPVGFQEGGELDSATSPDSVSVIAASKGIETFSLNEKSGNLAEATTNGPHT